MTDPLAILPKARDGGLRSGTFRFSSHDAYEDYWRKKGWRPAKLTDKYSCHHDHNGLLIEPPRSWWRRLMDWWGR